MSYIQKNFSVSYELTVIGSIKQWGFSQIDGKQNKPSVKVRAVNIEAKEDAKVGVREIETIVDFQIHTETEEQMLQLVEKVRKMRANKQPLYVTGDLPKKDSVDDILVVKSTIPLDEFLKKNNISLGSEKK